MELTREELAHDKTKKDLNETRNALVVANNEIVELKHTAQSKDIFAKGSIAAAKYLINQNPGYYNMDNMLD
jgi:dihydrodipicolinate reductase